MRPLVELALSVERSARQMTSIVASLRPALAHWRHVHLFSTRSKTSEYECSFEAGLTRDEDQDRAGNDSRCAQALDRADRSAAADRRRFHLLLAHARLRLMSRLVAVCTPVSV